MNGKFFMSGDLFLQMIYITVKPWFASNCILYIISGLLIYSVCNTRDNSSPYYLNLVSTSILGLAINFG